MVSVSLPANHTTGFQPSRNPANSAGQITNNQTISPLIVPAPLDSGTIQPILFGVLGVTLALGSLFIGYLQLRRMSRNETESHMEMGNVGYDDLSLPCLVSKF
jgi:hypothetical protein